MNEGRKKTADGSFHVASVQKIFSRGCVLRKRTKTITTGGSIKKL